MANVELEDLIRRDIAAGLAGDSSSPDEQLRPPIFAPVEGFTRQRDELPGLKVKVVDARRGTSAVEWSYKCTHVGDFAGIRRTGKTITIHGVTIVEQRGDNPPRFRRYVDWSQVMTELGVTATFRPSFDSLAEVPGFAEIALD